jgi:hypothetical protein
MSRNSVARKTKMSAATQTRALDPKQELIDTVTEASRKSLKNVSRAEQENVLAKLKKYAASLSAKPGKRAKRA